MGARAVRAGRREGECEEDVESAQLGFLKVRICNTDCLRAGFVGDGMGN